MLVTSGFRFFGSLYHRSCLRFWPGLLLERDFQLLVGLSLQRSSTQPTDSPLRPQRRRLARVHTLQAFHFSCCDKKTARKKTSKILAGSNERHQQDCVAASLYINLLARHPNQAAASVEAGGLRYKELLQPCGHCVPTPSGRVIRRQAAAK